jgi:hypothetical protein
MPQQSEIHTSGVSVVIAHNRFHRDRPMLRQPFRKYIQKRLTGHRPVVKKVAQDNKPLRGELI